MPALGTSAYATRTHLLCRGTVKAIRSTFRVLFVTHSQTLQPWRQSLQGYSAHMAYSLQVDKVKLQGVGMDTARKAVNRVVRRTYSRSQALVPVDTGLLRASGRPDLATDRGATVIGGVTYTAEYAAAVHEGRRALTIRAKRPGGKLRFVIDGRVIYAREVRQPARTGRPYLAQALREVAAQEGFSVTFG